MSSLRPAGFDDLGLRRALSDRMLPLVGGGNGVSRRARAGGLVRYRDICRATGSKARGLR